jgi:hypothetical protein
MENYPNNFNSNARAKENNKTILNPTISKTLKS